MVLTSLKPPNEIFTVDLHLWPREWYAVENYATAFAKAPLFRFMLNGALVCVAILLIQVLIAVPAAYALAKLSFRGRELCFALVIIGILIPIQVPAIPIYIALAWTGLLDTYSALILPFSVSAFGIFLLRQFFKTFPDEIIDAARLDGYSEIAIVWLVVLRSAWPAIGSFALFEFIYHWNDLYWPLVVLTDANLSTPPLGLLFYRTQTSGSDFGALMAATTVITAPLIVAFLLVQRQFKQGLAIGGIR